MNISYPNDPTHSEREEMLRAIREQFAKYDAMLLEALTDEGDTPAKIAAITADREQQRERFQAIYETWGGVGPIAA